jgi:hypothetical protein
VQLVCDKFHIIYNEVKVRDKILKNKSRATARKRDQLERKRWMWPKNRVNWTETESLKWE